MRHLLAAAVVALAFAAPRPAAACAPAPAAGAHVDIVGEEAIIVWDPAKKREHFIRRADFKSDAAGFGFLVPTPTKPELAEAADAAFERLRERIRPPIDDRARYEISWSLCALFMRGAAKTAAAPSQAPEHVQVLEEKRIAGYDAVVLAADDPGALASWLGDHGYAFRQELGAWLAPYVKASWKITAFKIAKTADDAGNLGTSAVRMSFDAERPFFPYREPSDQGDQRVARSLRVFLFAPARMAGAVGATKWPGQVRYAKQLDDGAALLAGALEAADLPGSAWLTVAEDYSSRRPGDDELWFEPDPKQAELLPPPQWSGRTVRIPLLLDVAAVLLLLGWGGWRWRRGRAAS